MEASVELVLGDLFSSPCDLIVLPCSTNGTVATIVRDKLAIYELPFPPSRMTLGGVKIARFSDGSRLATFVAYAASVAHMSSTDSAIGNIGRELGKATHHHSSIRRIHAPLLGAGAGGLDALEVVKNLSEGFRQTAESNSVLAIYVLRDELFKSLKIKAARTVVESNAVDNQNLSAIRLFISYSHSSPAHEKWVEEIAAYMRQNGIDARLDAWNLDNGADLPQWMSNELTQADRVLIVSDEVYANKANGRAGGVGWETMIIQGDLYRLPPDNRKYLIVVCSRDLPAGTPQYLRSKFTLHWPPSKKQNVKLRESLLREIYQIKKVPPLGRPPSFVL